MSISLSSPVTGGAQTGFTSPTYTTVADIYPGGVNGKQYAVTALGGTQTGVRAHAVSDPFTIAFTRPTSPKALQSPNSVTGRYGNIPKNSYSVIVRKGVNYAANQAPELALCRMYCEIPAGADAYDPANIRAMNSLLVGAVNAQSAGWGDTQVTGIL
ncbi:coat protein [ssRNA phage Gephyllon.1_12]|jgi:hypothetical protein|uniref:Coat protein n=2 Tax=Norzivirales TaxID=2842247 RepID=A0A8S5KYQ1_9VIRU|nr:coat protein [ssRNA phage Gephyllon.1_12]QDH88521.1 MAG: hypothetical protein H1BulkLitter51011_000003 [Leviviridae sp.]DAD50002.1 TPA_asm: coat protein [ssRNA phage Gephyllon.1_12]